MRYISVFVAFVLMAAIVGELPAQETADVLNKRIGTAAGTELLIPVGARDLAMGGASIATTMGTDAIYWNPAGLGRIEAAAEGHFSTMSYIGGIQVNYGAVAVDFGGFGAVGVSIKSLDFGSIPLTTNDDPEGRFGRTFSPAFIVFGVSYARAFTDAITAGGTLKLISEKIERVTGSAVAIDIGVQYHNVAGFKGLHLGVALKNIGPQMSFDGTGLLRRATSSEGRRPEQFYKSVPASFELPSLVEIGLAWSQNIGEEMNYMISSSFVNNNLGLDSYRVGGEFGYTMGKAKFFARGGVDMSPTGADDEQIFGPTFGLGLFYSTVGVDITIDYAYRAVQYFDANSMFTLKLSF